ncbi:RING-TYPE E3 UBIQUITIN TRANSFERASE [Salix koriyanagi]|uniref:RING-TYPE E3 UBIQUITIN TRANSFERASE n=1 Tax=Salix koriyanagi TaxID=2511006 RepID=A0A9Q0P3R7_9ROSI|nr:RING-TYPE E3 UBIQUITIN TRANSFERASE [Salix koriyanagi]
MKAEKLKKNEDDLEETVLAETMKDEEKAVSSWENKVAFVLCNHEKGSIFKALEECFKSNSLEMARSCLVISTWLIYMLSVLPDTGVRSAARKSLLDEFINVLQSTRNMEEKILATLALRTFVGDPAALEELGKHAKCIYSTLRKLKRSSPVITDVLKSLMNLSSVNPTELWSCTEVVEVESCANDEVLSLLHFKGRVISSHSDGTIKVWDAGKRVLRLIQEVRDHTKAVTCLYIPSSEDKLYSGSLDKTIRVWAIKPEEIHCIQVHDVKETVYELTANCKVACFVSQGPGVTVYRWSGVPKHININFNKTVKCLAMTGDTLYCGISGYSIQEVDLRKLTSTTFYSGTRKLLVKQSIYSLQIQDGLLFAGGSSVDGTAGKVFSHSSKAVTGSFSTGFDIQRIAVNDDFIFTATKSGIIEVWSKERVTRIASIKTGSGWHARITCLTSDMDGKMLYAGTSDGKIQAWSLD